jgi:hypothetical protein
MIRNLENKDIYIPMAQTFVYEDEEEINEDSGHSEYMMKMSY